VIGEETSERLDVIPAGAPLGKYSSGNLAVSTIRIPAALYKCDQATDFFP
jgi:hypothetical protein